MFRSRLRFLELRRFSSLFIRHSQRTYSRDEGSESFPQRHNIQQYTDGKTASELLSESVVGPGEASEPEFPSERDDRYWEKYKTYDQWLSSQEKHSYRPEVAPESTSILLFPGQGSQFVGMGRKLLEYPKVQEMYNTASNILGYNLLDMCINGPQSELDKTRVCQPAIFVTSLAAVEKLKHEKANVVENCVTAAGFSVGEISALAFSGAITFTQGVSLVKVRGEEMQRASENTDSGMMSVFLRPQHKIKLACHAAKLYCQERLGMQEPVCEIANHLYTECKVVAGHKQALEFIEQAREEFGISQCKHLPVSGAFHTKLMKPATYRLRQFLETENFQNPKIPVHSNVNGFRYKQLRYIKKTLVEQVYRPVKWEQILHILYSRSPDTGFPMTYEVGPGRQLGFMLNKTNKKAMKNYHNVEV